LTKRGLTDDKAVVQREVELKVPALKGVPGSEPMLHKAVLLITPSGGGEDAEANRLVTMRGTLMVVHDEKVGRLPTGARDFQAVLLAGHATRAPAAAADSAERFLRAAEPPEHDKWQVTDDLRATYARGVMSAIKNFLTEARREVREAITPTAVPAKDIDAVLDPVITPRPQPKRTPVRTGFPAIKSARGQIIDGAWNMRVEVRLPEREDPWVRKPVLKFAVRSGSPIEGRWAEIRPETGCREDSGTLVFDAGARSAVFIAISDPTSHPVDAAMTVAEIDLVRAREGAS
jgi:RNA polymerase primary sigma factor